jgi:hypothetical protein
MKIVKNTIIILLVVVLALAGYIYLNRQELLNKSIDKVLTDFLPPYIEIDNLSLDLDKKTIRIENLRILNPEGFLHPYLAQATLISCGYKQRDNSNLLKGISIEDIKLAGLRLYIDRDRDGEVNIQHMKEVLKGSVSIKKMGIKAKALGIFSYLLSPVKSINQLLDIDPTFNISSGVLTFNDDYIDKAGYVTIIEDIDAVVILDLRKNLKGIDYLTSEGRGVLNGKPRQYIEWDTKYDPTTAKLTMANELIIRDIDFVHFMPYYDKFSPFIFKKARASGELMFNFDEGNIGSMNEIRFSDTEIEPKKDHTFNKFWPTGTEDLYRYFSDPSGEIVFDFKIKGSIDKPEFHLGSKTKQALSRMVIYKIADIIFNDDKEQDTNQQSPDTPSQEKSDVERIFDILKGL